jgi:WS/DGAT/MGAT family acyltransferase
MHSADAVWLRMDRPSDLMVLNALLWFDEPLDWPRVTRVFDERIVQRFPRYRQRVCEGEPPSGPAWEDDPDFDLARHFHRVALPAPGDQAVLQEVVSDQISRPLERTRPLWDVYLLEGYGAGCAVLVRMHHCIADGIALARLMMSLTDAQRSSARFARGDEPRRSRTLGALPPDGRPAGPIAHESLDAAVHPRRLAALAKTARNDARTLAKLLVPGTDAETSLRTQGHVTHRVAWSAPVRLSAVKDIAHALDATVNDVLVAAVAGALGALLREHGEHADGVHALVPFNLRSLDGPLPRDLGNRFGLIQLGLPVGVEDPASRLRVVKTRMDAIRHSHEGPFSFGTLEAMGKTLAAGEDVDLFSPEGTMILTNVPGPRRPVTLAATPVRGMLVWAPCSGRVGMSVSVCSYAGKVTVGFLVNAGVLPEPESLTDHFRREVLLLARHARGARTASAAVS